MSASALARDTARPRRRRQEVFAAAATVFGRRGYADATVREIADEVGLHKGSIYYYVATKEDLLFGLLSATHVDVDAILGDVKAMPELASRARLREYVRRQVRYCCQNAEAVALYRREVAQLSAGRRRAIGARRHLHVQFLADMLGEEPHPRRERTDTPVAVNCVLTMIMSVAQWYRPGGSPPVAEVANQCATFALGCVAPPAGH